MSVEALHVLPSSAPRLMKRATPALTPRGVAMQDDLLTIAIVPDDDHVTLRLTGEIDMSTAQSVREAALQAMRQHDRTLQIDLSGVTFIDSTGLEVLLATRRRATVSGGQLQLIDPTHAVLRVLEVTGVDRLFQIQPGPAPVPQ
jgi:anti-sigma B factor antagonist